MPVSEYRFGPKYRAMAWCLAAMAWAVAAFGAACVVVAILRRPASPWPELLTLGGFTLGMLYTGGFATRWARQVGRNFVRLEDGGVRAQIGERTFWSPWAEMKAVGSSWEGTPTWILAAGPDADVQMAFTGIDVPRAKQAAEAIARRIGVEITKLPVQ